jgi:hypothetical protein
MSSIQPKFVKPPFDDPTADLILRSSDRHDFRVHKSLLYFMSEIFQDMLSLPQPSEDSEPTKSDDGTTHPQVPVIDLPEKGEVLRALLSFCHPRAVPECVGLDAIPLVLEAGVKYRTAFLSVQLLAQLQCHISTNPLRVYALACICLDLPATNRSLAESIAKSAARELLKYEPPFQTLEFTVYEQQGLSAKYLQKLYTYHEACGIAAKSLTEYKNMIPGWNIVTKSEIRRGCACACSQVCEWIGGLELLVPLWMVYYLQAAGDALHRIPYGKVLLHEKWHAEAALGQRCDSCKSGSAESRRRAWMIELADKIDEAVAAVSPQM